MKEFNASRHIDRIIKVCGMKDEANIRSVACLTPLLMGFIFYRHSPRYAGDLNPEVVKTLPRYITPVGVFVNEDTDEVERVCTRYGITTVQLHGSETPGQCHVLRERGFTVLKAFGIDENTGWEEMKPYEEAADMFVFDTKCGSSGGSGRKFRWSILDSYPLSTPYLLSGGIGPEDSEAILAAMRPKMAGVDLNSRFETSPGIKDIDKLIHLILSLRKHNEDESVTIPFWTKRQ